MRNSIFYLKNKLFRNKAMALFEDCLKHEKLNSEELSELNWQKRKKIVNYVYENIPFYKNYYNSLDFHPGILKNEKDWLQVPVLKKEMIREYIEEFKNPTVKGKYFVESTTGGTTGMPLKVYHDKRFYNEILSWRMLKWWGLGPAENMAKIWRIPKHKQSHLSSLLNKAIWWPTKRILLDSSISNGEIEKFLKLLFSVKPPLIIGYAGALEQVALYMKKKGIATDFVKIVWATSSPTTIIQKKLFKEVFNAPLLDQYGSCEIMWIASNCPNTECLHVNSDYRHIDILNDDGSLAADGFPGEIAITDLDNYAFPLIKYLNGDRSSYISKPCSCNLPFPLINPIKGRVADCIYLPDGFIAGEFMTTLFDEYVDFIDGFQVTQRLDYSVEVNVIIKEENELIEKGLNNIKNVIRKKSRDQIDISIKKVNEIPHERGKIRFIKSELHR